MTSIFQRALGADFSRLHPQLKRRFGFCSTDGTACVGYGWMDEVWHRPGFSRPFLALGARRNILLTGAGTNVPFVIENYAYRDSFGRETVTFARTFWFDSEEHWDATMVYDADRGTLVDYLGTHQHVAVDLSLAADAAGGLVIRSGRQHLREGWLRLPVPQIATGDACVRESYDDDAGCFRIEVTVANRRFGPLFGYRGSFRVTYRQATGVPARCRPARETATK